MKKMLLLTCLWAFFTGISTAQTTASTQEFYYTDKVHTLKFQFNQENWAYLLDSLRIQGDGYLLGNVEIDGQRYENAGIRYRGTKSFRTGSKRNAFSIKLNYINKKQNHQGIRKFKLSNALRDPSLLREVMGYEIARNYMPAPQAGYVELSINGEKYGLFVSIEAVDKDFLSKHFGDDEGTLVKAASTLPEKIPAGCKKNLYGSLEYESDAQCYMHNYELVSDEGWDDLIELTDILNNAPKDIEKVLNVDRALWMLAFNNVLVNLSSYTGHHSHNFYLYKDKNGQFNPIVWDLNLAFGSYKNTGIGSDLDLAGLQTMDPLLHHDSPTKPLVSKLLGNEEYQKIYLDHIRTIIYDHFVNGEYESRAEDLQNVIRSAFLNDPNKFYAADDFSKSLSTTIGKRSKIPGIVELMQKRARFLKKHPEVAIFPPEVEKVELKSREKFSTQKINDFQFTVTVKNLPNRVKLMYRTDSTMPYQTVYMANDGNTNDGKAGDNVFGVTIKPDSKNIEYYIQAENAKAAGFYPSNYMHEPKTVSLEELNK